MGRRGGGGGGGGETASCFVCGWNSFVEEKTRGVWEFAIVFVCEPDRNQPVVESIMTVILLPRYSIFKQRRISRATREDIKREEEMHSIPFRQGQARGQAFTKREAIDWIGFHSRAHPNLPLAREPVSIIHRDDEDTVTNLMICMSYTRLTGVCCCAREQKTTGR